jgi:hypothetical protein
MMKKDPPADSSAHPPQHQPAAWNVRCQAILSTNARHLGNIEIAAAIEAATGMRFHNSTISRHRKELGIPAPRRRNFTAALLRARQLATREP